MTPGLHLHRSLTFWAGLITILFTCGTWRDTCDHEHTLQWSQFSIDSIPHAVLISRSLTAGNYGPIAIRRPASLSPDPSKPREVFPSPFLVHAQKTYLVTKPPRTRTWKQAEQDAINSSGPGSWTILLPYWLILLTLLLTWTILLLFRARRRRAHLLQIP